MNYSVLPLLLALLIFVGFACGSDDPPVVVTVLAAAIGGSLIEEDGCLRIGDSSGSDAIVWQRDVLEVERQGNTFQIIESDKQPVTWRLGDEISGGGGQIGAQIADEHAGAGFSERCPGPYWLLGIVGVPREESANPTVIASATALPPRNLVETEGANAYELGDVESDARVLTIEETQAKDTQWYADRYGITLDEATLQLELGAAISQLQSKLRRNEPGSFAGLWVEHTPEYKVVVCFTGNGDETIRPYIQSGALSEIVEVRMVDLSEATLIASQRSAVQIADEFGIDNHSSVDVRNNRVDFYVADKADLYSKLAARGVSLPLGVSVVQAEYLSNPTANSSTPPPVVVTVLAAAIGGSLIEEDDCLRIGDSSGSDAIVWQKDVLEVERQGNTFQIIEGDKQPVTWRLGDEIRGGGGSISRRIADEHAGAGFSERCEGPYFLLGSLDDPVG